MLVYGLIVKYIHTTVRIRWVRLEDLPRDNIHGNV